MAKDTTASACMREALDTYNERRAEYGPSELKFGKVMDALFPNGLILKSADDWSRVGILVQIVSKLTRYSHNLAEPHLDSAHDLGVYAFMLEGFDRDTARYRNNRSDGQRDNR